MRQLRFVLPSVALFVGFLFSTTAVHAKKEYTTKEKKPCAHCHVTKVPKDKKDASELTEAGKYYKDHDLSFKGYTPKN